MYWQLSFYTHASVRNVVAVVPSAFDRVVTNVGGGGLVVKRLGALRQVFGARLKPWAERFAPRSFGQPTGAFLEANALLK
jgi:hypothetical protein